MESMTYKQLRDIFGKIKRVHCKAAEYCTDVAVSESCPLSLLGDFFQQRQEALGKRLGSLEEGERKTILDTWVQYVPIQEVDKALADLCDSREESPDVRVQKCLTLQQEIADFFRQLATNMHSPKIREILQVLAASETVAIKDLGLASVMHHDT